MAAPPLAAVLFDLDGTLHDKRSTLRRFAALQHASARLGGQGVPLGAWTDAYVAWNEERLEKTAVFDRLAEAFGLAPAQRDALLAQFDGGLGAAAVAFPGALTLLSACRHAGLRIGVVTNGRDAFQRSKLDGLRLTPWIDAVVTSGGFGRKKPDPGPFLACLAQLGVRPEAAAFVGDDPDADIRPAVALGLRAVLKGAGPCPGAWHCTDNLHAVRRLLVGAA